MKEVGKMFQASVPVIIGVAIGMFAYEQLRKASEKV